MKNQAHSARPRFDIPLQPLDYALEIIAALSVLSRIARPAFTYPHQFNSVVNIRHYLGNYFLVYWAK